MYYRTVDLPDADLDRFERAARSGLDDMTLGAVNAFEQFGTPVQKRRAADLARAEQSRRAARAERGSVVGNDHTSA